MATDSKCKICGQLDIVNVTERAPYCEVCSTFGMGLMRSDFMQDIIDERIKQKRMFPLTQDLQWVHQELIYFAMYMAAPEALNEVIDTLFRATRWDEKWAKRDSKTPEERLNIAIACLMAERERLEVEARSTKATTMRRALDAVAEETEGGEEYDDSSIDIVGSAGDSLVPFDETRG